MENNRIPQHDSQRRRLLLTAWLLALMACLPTALWAQQVSGTVTDLQSGEPLIGVTVKEQGSQNAAVTDMDGYVTMAMFTGAEKNEGEVEQDKSADS